MILLNYYNVLTILQFESAKFQTVFPTKFQLNMSAVKALKDKRVDERLELLLFGYNREHTRDIPIPITYLCLLYYFIHDKWNKILISPSIKLKQDNATIEHIGNDWNSCNAFLKNKWSSGRCQWKFQVINLNHNRNFDFLNRISIGIWKAQYTPPLNAYFLADLDYVRGFGTAINRRKRAYGKLLQVGDIIEMFVDFDHDKLRMRWQINGSHFHEIWEPEEGRRISQSEYIVGVNLLMPGDSIKLLS